MFPFGMRYHLQYSGAKLVRPGKCSSEIFRTCPASPERNSKCHLFFSPNRVLFMQWECWPLNQNIHLCPMGWWGKELTLSKVVYKCVKTVSKGVMLKALVFRLQNSGLKQLVLFQVAEDNRDFLTWGVWGCQCVIPIYVKFKQVSF